MATFYVDDPMDWGDTVAQKNPQTAHHIRRYSGGGRLWSHLMTDGTDDELLEFAVRLYGSRVKAEKWIQHKGELLCHYDVTPAMRERALKLGAVVLEDGQLRPLIRAKRDRRLTLEQATFPLGASLPGA